MGLFVIMGVLGVVVGFFMYRDRRTKMLIAQINAEHMARAGHGAFFHDNAGDDEVYVDYIEESRRGSGFNNAVEMSPHGSASGNSSVRSRGSFSSRGTTGSGAQP